MHVPPLRARRSDIAVLANYFLDRHRHVRNIQLSGSAVDALLTYEWPGNVRELARVIEGAVALAASDQIGLEDLPPRVTNEYTEILDPSLCRDDTMRAWGSRYARIVLDRCGNNKRHACRALGISYHTLQAYLAYGKGMSVVRGKPDQDTKDHHRDPRGELAEKPSAIRQERGGR